MAPAKGNDENEVYRETTLGRSMEAALQQLEKAHPELDPNLKETIRRCFDKGMKELVPPNGPVVKIFAKQIGSYTFVEHTWKFNLDNVCIRKKRFVAEPDKLVLTARLHKNFHGRAKRQKKRMQDPDI